MKKQTITVDWYSDFNEETQEFKDEIGTKLSDVWVDVEFIPRKEDMLAFDFRDILEDGSHKLVSIRGYVKKVEQFIGLNNSEITVTLKFVSVVVTDLEEKKLV